MTMNGWQRQYLDALLRSKTHRIKDFESLEFFTTIVNEPADGVQELLLHRLIGGLEDVSDAVNLLDLIQNTGWKKYGPRVLARIGDTEAVLKSRPDLAEHFKILRQRTGYTTYSIKDWRLIGCGTNVRRPNAPVWSGRTTGIQKLIQATKVKNLTVEDVSKVLQYYFKNGVRIFQIGLITFASDQNDWALTLHKVLTAPYLEITTEPRSTDYFVTASPVPMWSPHWLISVDPDAVGAWKIVDEHTGRTLQGLGTAGIYDQISIVLALSGLLRDGINLCPIDDGLVHPPTSSQPIWGFRRREFSAALTKYQADDVRAVALGFLEEMPATRRVSMFRSRLALRLVREAWARRKSASQLVPEGNLYRSLVRAAQLFGDNRFQEVIDYIENGPYGGEPAFRFFYDEARTALRIIDRLDNISLQAIQQNVTKPEEILCVTHASVPDQNGGYAIRAHGVLTSLRNAGIKITAVTRPGFPSGSLTKNGVDIVDDVEYHRLPATSITRNHGEIRHMESFIEPFKSVFQESGVGTVHVRSTFLIALPALIAAHELGLKVLYEVSGLWELVYQDREHDTHLVKRSRFADLAETLTMARADLLVVMNEAVRQIAIDRGVDDGNIRVAPNAVNVDSFAPLLPPENEIFTVGYLGSFQDYEGIYDIIDAAKILLGSGRQLRVLLVGDGVELSGVRSRVIAEGLEDIFEFTGRVPHEAVIDQYSRMDIMVYPRRSTGATRTITPLKPFEALALAKPIVVSDVEPLKEIAGTNERGLVFRSGDIEHFAFEIQKLIDNQQLRMDLGKRGRRWVVENRNWGKVVETFIEGYKTLVNS